MTKRLSEVCVLPALFCARMPSVGQGARQGCFARSVAKLFVVFCVLFYGCVTTIEVENVKKSEARYNLGLSYLDKDRLQEASVEFQKAIKLNPKHYKVQNLLGYISTRFGKYDEAISYYKRAISISPDYSEAMNNLGVTYLEIENWDEAIKYFQMALENPVYATPQKAYSNMGYAYYKKGEYIKVIDTIEQVFIRYPEGLLQHNYFPNYILGLTYMKLGDIEVAIDEFKKALSITPENINVHWELANAYLRTGDNEKAVKHFKIVSESDFDKGKTKKALEYIKLLKE